MTDDRKSQNEPQPPQDKPFTTMTLSEKLRFMGKALVFFVSGGFIFPTMWTD